MFLMI